MRRTPNWATAEDYRRCAELHNRYGTTYAFASKLFPREFRPKVDAIYGFVRVPDEWVDTLAKTDPVAARKLLDDYQAELVAAYGGARPQNGVLRAFTEVALGCTMPISEPICFLESMREDFSIHRFPTYQDLQHYMRGSAVAVGVMMCWAMGSGEDAEAVRSAKLLGEAMQMTNFLRDIGEDLERGRVYLPQEDMERFGVSESVLEAGVVTPEFRDLMRFEIERTKTLYADSEGGIRRLRPEFQRPVKLALVLYGKILDKIIERDYDVFTGRARTTRFEKLTAFSKVMTGRVEW